MWHTSLSTLPLSYHGLLCEVHAPSQKLLHPRNRSRSASLCLRPSDTNNKQQDVTPPNLSAMYCCAMLATRGSAGFASVRREQIESST